jgi:hypothetical protein
MNTIPLVIKQTNSKMKVNFVSPFKKTMKLVPLALSLLILNACKTDSGNDLSSINTSISSPGNINSIQFFLDAAGTPYYLVKHKDKLVIDSSSLGFDLKGQNALKSGFILQRVGCSKQNLKYLFPRL